MSYNQKSWYINKYNGLIHSLDKHCIRFDRTYEALIIGGNPILNQHYKHLFDNEINNVYVGSTVTIVYCYHHTNIINYNELDLNKITIIYHETK